MSSTWRMIGRHVLLAAAVVAGIIGTGIVFNGALVGNLEGVTRGTPLLLVGLWWSGRELGMGMLANQARRDRPKGQSTGRGGKGRG